MPASDMAAYLSGVRERFPLKAICFSTPYLDIPDCMTLQETGLRDGIAELGVLIGVLIVSFGGGSYTPFAAD